MTTYVDEYRAAFGTGAIPAPYPPHFRPGESDPEWRLYARTAIRERDEYKARVETLEREATRLRRQVEDYRKNMVFWSDRAVHHYRKWVEATTKKPEYSDE